MSDSLEIDGKTYLSVKEACSTFSYSRDHVTRLAKTRKIVALQVGRKWFVRKESLQSYYDIQKVESDIKRKHLGLDRQTEIGLRSGLALREQDGEQAVKRVGLKAFVACSFFLLVSSYVGIELCSSEIQEVRQEALAFFVAPSPEVKDFVLIETETILLPVFTSTSDDVLVDHDRKVDKPAVDSNWLEINP